MSFMSLLFTWNDVLGIKKSFYTILLSLDGIIYNLICWFYDLFMFLANMDIFKDADYENIVRRIYIILGVVMLFVLTYSLLKAIINPDEFAKGENSFANIIKNVLVSLVIITLLPTIFDVAFQVQNVILKSDVIGKLILSDDFTTYSVNSGGRTMAVTIFQAFFRYNDEAETSEDYGSEAAAIKSDIAVTFNQVERGLSFYVFNGKYKVVDGSGEERNFPELIVDNVIDYTWLVSSVAGGFVLWCILLFCFDLGIRVVKLAFYQLIAPIAVICRVLPNKKAKTIFDNWLKIVVATFMEVFIRVFIMYIGIYFIILVADRGPDILAYALESGLRPLHALFAEAFVIMGIIAFIRQAPKLIQDIFGFDTKGMSLGFKGLTERLGNGGFYSAVNAVGGLATGGVGGMLRGARYGLHNNNFRGIGAEAERRRQRLNAIQNGATPGGIFMDRMRNAFGFDSRYDRDMHQIDEGIREQDEIIGNLDRQIEATKARITTERIGERKKGNSDAQTTAKALLDAVDRDIMKEKSTYEDSVKIEMWVDKEVPVYENVEVPTGGVGPNGMMTRTEQRQIGTKTERVKEEVEVNGNLAAMQKFIDSHAKDIDADEMTRIGQEMDRKKKDIANRRLAAHLNGSDVSAEFGNLLRNLRSNETLSTTFMDAAGQSHLDNVIDQRLHDDNENSLYTVVDDFSKQLQGEIDSLDFQEYTIEAGARPFESQKTAAQHRKNELQQSKNDRVYVVHHYEAEEAQRRAQDHQNNGNNNRQ